MSNAIEKQVKEVKLYTYVRKWSHETEFKVSVTTHLPTTGDMYTVIPLSETTIEVPIKAVTEKQLLKAEVDTLEKQLLKEKADSHVRIVAIEEKIQSLLCIENQSDK